MHKIPLRFIMTSFTKANKTWCGVCNTTKHDAKRCDKAEGYNITLCQFVETVKAKPEYSRDFRKGKYDKSFLKYALSSLRMQGIYIAESNQYIYASYDGLDKRKRTYDELVNDFNVAMFEIRIKVRDVLAEGNKCPICMESMIKKATCTTVCKHTFCSDCYHKTIGNTLKHHHSVSCPMCRNKLL